MAEKKITFEEFAGFCNRMSGKDSLGEAKAVIAYQTYALEDDAESNDRKTIYSVNKARVEMSVSKINPTLVSMDIIFNSFDDTELKLLWGRLQRLKKNEQEHPEKTWIFHFVLMERASVPENEEEDGKKSILTANLMNPCMQYLTRETPTTLSQDKLINGELLGGNIIRMLFPVNLVSFEENSDYDTAAIRGEVLREKEASEYIDSYIPPVDDGANWN